MMAAPGDAAKSGATYSVDERGSRKMHSSSKDAACTRLATRQHTRANHFSFPPTQRFGSLDSTTKAFGRSADQHLNLQRSFGNLLDALHMPATS